MISKIFITTLLLNLLLIFNACAEVSDNNPNESDWFVPDGIVYVPGDASKIEKVKNELQSTFANPKKELYKLTKKYKGYFFLGPLLSSRISEESPEMVSELRTVGYQIKLSEDFAPKLQGFLAKTNKEKKLLSQLLSDKIDNSDTVNLRRLEPEELAFMWYFISWEIKEPVFILETDEHSFLVDVGAISGDQIWMEEISNPCFRFGFDEVVSPCLCFDIFMEDKKWSGGFLEKTKQCK